MARRIWQEIGWDRMCTASRQQIKRSLLALASYCSRVLDRLDHHRWCCFSAIGLQAIRWVMAEMPWQCLGRSCRCSKKNGSRKTGISALLMSGSSLIFCNHGRVMGRFCFAYDWEPMVLVEEIFLFFV
jgi:hypothetical protein